MGKWLAWLLLFVLGSVVVSVVLLPPVGAGALGERIEEYRPALEVALGGSLPEHVRARTTRPGRMARILVGEIVGILERMHGRPADDQMRLAARGQADLLSQHLFGKVEIATGTLHILPENLEWISEVTSRWKDVKSPEFRDVVLIHELVHVYQYGRFHLARFFGEARTDEELIARNSVVEGHAQFITRHVARLHGLSEEFDLLKGTQMVVPDEASPLARSILRGAQAMAAFPYHNGEILVAATVGELGYEAALERLFLDPPRTVAQVADPRLYVVRSEASLAFDTTVARVRRFLEEEGEVVAEETLSVPGLGQGRRSVELAGHSGRTVRLVWDPDGAHVGAVRRGDVAVWVTVSPDDEPLAARMRECTLELARTTTEGSPWSGLGGAAARDAMLESLGDPHWGVRWRAVRNLGRMDADVEAALRSMLSDENASVRVDAVRALARHGWLRRSDLPALERDPEREVRSAARHGFRD